MAIIFLDASAIVKRYIHERGSVWIPDLCEARDEGGDKTTMPT